MQSAGTKITHIQGYLLFMEAKNASMLLMDWLAIYDRYHSLPFRQPHLVLCVIKKRVCKDVLYNLLTSLFVGPIILCHITQMCIPHLYKLLGRLLLKSTLQHLVSSWYHSPFMETQEPPPTTQHFFDLITPQPHHCMAVFVGSTRQGRDIGMHREMGQRCPYIQLWYPYILESCCVRYRNISDITTEGSTWALTMLATMCFQFSILNIYHPYGYHNLKGTAIMWWSHYACDYWDLVFCTNFYHLLLPRAWREDTATMTEKLRNSQPIKLTIIAPSTRLQKECTSWQKPVHRGLTTPYFPTHQTARAAESAEISALANNCPTSPPNRTKRKHSQLHWLKVQMRLVFSNTLLRKQRIATTNKYLINLKQKCQFWTFKKLVGWDQIFC
jgi:hypothetical protein